LPMVYYDKSAYVETATGNRVSRNSTFCGSQNIVLLGRTILMEGCILRGDLAAIRMGKYCILSEQTVIRPSYKKFSKGFTFFPIHVGDHVMIEPNCILMPAQIGSYVFIGRGSIVGRSAVIKDCCEIRAGSVIAADSVVPPFSILAGNPARVIGEMPECTQDLMTQLTRDFYDNFQPAPKV